jgi:RNA recognition motif-containing protein
MITDCAESRPVSDRVDRLNIFVKHLPNDITAAHLYRLFSPFGEIVSTKVMVRHFFFFA